MPKAKVWLGECDIKKDVYEVGRTIRVQTSVNKQVVVGCLIYRVSERVR